MSKRLTMLKMTWWNLWFHVHYYQLYGTIERAIKRSYYRKYNVFSKCKSATAPKRKQKKENKHFSRVSKQSNSWDYGHAYVKKRDLERGLASNQFWISYTYVRNETSVFNLFLTLNFLISTFGVISKILRYCLLWAKNVSNITHMRRTWLRSTFKDQRLRIWLIYVYTDYLCT